MAAAAAATTAAATAATASTAIPAVVPAVPITSSSEWIQGLTDFFSFRSITNVNETYIQKFTFVQGVTPLSSVIGVLLCIGLYVLTVRSIQRWVKRTGRPFDLGWFVTIHNACMSIGSAVLWFALLAELIMRGSQTGLWNLTCDPQGVHTSGTVYFIYYLNYIFKYIELIDTLLLALRDKPIPFLHIYHHAATLFLCWTQLWAQSCIQWLPIVINLLVHIIMYAYYCLHSIGVDIWWKKYLTMLQIVQFVAALTGCVLAFGSRLLSYSLLPSETFRCWGTETGAWIGIGIIASYLYLFIVLFGEKYSSKKKRGTVSPASNADHDKSE